MCGFVGFVDFKKDISQNTKILENMNNCLAKRGPDKHVALAHKRLIVVDPKGRKATND